jgi:hypothetical protein
LGAENGGSFWGTEDTLYQSKCSRDIPNSFTVKEAKKKKLQVTSR